MSPTCFCFKMVTDTAVTEEETQPGGNGQLRMDGRTQGWTPSTATAPPHPEGHWYPGAKQRFQAAAVKSLDFITRSWFKTKRWKTWAGSRQLRLLHSQLPREHHAQAAHSPPLLLLYGQAAANTQPQKN